MRKNPLLMTATYLFCFTLLFLFCACQSQSGGAEKETAALPAGNSDANLNNLGLAATDGETLYDIASDGGYDIIYKTAADGSAAAAVVGLDGYIQFLNVSGGYFYFVGSTDNSNGKPEKAIFRADLKAKEKEWLFDLDGALSVTYMRVVEDTVFYAATTGEEAAALYGVNLAKGKRITLLTAEKTIDSIHLTAEGIYYAEGNRICRANLDGSEKEILYTGEIWLGNLILDGDTLYFVETQRDKTDSICALSADGGEAKTILAGVNWINYLNIAGETLYYADHTYDGDGNLETAAFYGLSLSSGKTALVGETDGPYAGFSIIGNKLIYQEEHDGALTAKVIPLAE